MVCGAVDGLVFTDIDIVRVVGNIEIRAVGDVREILVLGGGDDLHLAILLGLGNGLLGPGTGLHIAGDTVFHQVDGDHGELNRSAALDEQHLVIVGNAHQLAEVGLSLIPDLLEHLGAMAHLHNTHTAAAVVHHLGGDLFQNRLRHHGRACGEVVSTAVFHRVCSFLIFGWARNAQKALRSQSCALANSAKKGQPYCSTSDFP